MTALAALLDELDALRAAEEETLPWRLDAHDKHHVQDRHGNGVTGTYLADDAALIVAAVNAVPQLVAALRAVEALAEGDDLVDMVLSHDECGPDHRPCLSQLGEDVADRLRAALTAPLTEQNQEAGRG